MSKLNFKYTKIACYLGFVVQAIINNFLPILFIVFQKNYSLSYEKLGRIIFINFFTQLIADFLTTYIARCLGYRKTVIVSHFLASAGLVMLALLPLVFKGGIYLCITLSVIVYAFGSGIIEVIMSPIVEMIPGKNKSADMVFTHSFYCWGQAFTVIVTTLFVALFGFSNWNLIPLVWAVVPVLNIFLFNNVPIIEPEKAKERKTEKSFFKTRNFWCFAVFMVSAGATEIAMSEWSSVFVQNAFNLNKTVGDLLGPCAFAISMGLGRVFFGITAGKLSVRRALILNNILCAVCYFAVGVFNVPALSLLACALCGFGVSLSWPGTYSLAAAAFPTGGTLMFSIFALCGDMGCSCGPWLLGAVADRTSLNTGFAVCALFPLVMALTAIFGFKEKDCKNI